ERLDGQRSTTLWHRCGGDAGAARQPPVAIRHAADARRAGIRRCAGTAAGRRHGRCEELAPRHGVAAGRRLPAGTGSHMKRRMAVLALATLVTLAACRGGHQAGVTELVYATPYSPAHPFSRADLRWIA